MGSVWTDVGLIKGVNTEELKGQTGLLVRNLVSSRASFHQISKSHCVIFFYEPLESPAHRLYILWKQTLQLEALFVLLSSTTGEAPQFKWLSHAMQTRFLSRGNWTLSNVKYCQTQPQSHYRPLLTLQRHIFEEELIPPIMLISHFPAWEALLFSFFFSLSLWCDFTTGCVPAEELTVDGPLWSSVCGQRMCRRWANKGANMEACARCLLL